MILGESGKSPLNPELVEFDGLFAMHFPINDLRLGSRVTLGGQVAIGGVDIELDARIKNFAVKKVRARLSTKAEVNLQLTVDAGADNTNAPLAEREHDILAVPLMKIIFAIADVPVEIQPTFKMKVGAAVAAPTRLVLPVQSSVVAGVEMLWDDDRPVGEKTTFEPFHEVTPLALSDPTIAETLSATASVFAEAQLEVKIDGLLGPFVGVRATAEFGVAPLQTPWWSIDGDLDLTAGFTLSLLGAEIVEAGGPVGHIASFFHRDAGGSATPGSAQPAEGAHVRWGRGALWDGGVAPVDTLTARVAGTAEDVFVALAANTVSIYSPIMRVGAQGDILWTISPQLAPPSAIGSVPDGGFVLAGTKYISRHDGSGNVLWARDFNLTSDTGGVQNQYVRSVIARETAPGSGSYEFFVCGYRDDALNTLDADPFMLRYDNAGTLISAHRFASADSEAVHDAILLRDGNLLFCGSSKRSGDGTTPPGPGTPSGAWLMKASPDGAIEWAKQSQAGLSIFWESVVENPDGVLFTGGRHDHTVTLEYPALLIARHAANGQLEEMISVGEAMPLDKANLPHVLNGERTLTPGYADWLPRAGLTIFDLSSKVAWTPMGLVAGGTTALVDDRAPVLMCFTEKLSLRWLTTHEGARGDSINDLVVTDEGIFTAGFSNSFTSPGSPAPGAAFFKVPFEGRLDLDPASGGLAKFLQPSVYNLKSSSYIPGFPGPDQGYSGTFDVTLTPAPQTLGAGPGVPNFTPYTLTSWTPLERGEDAPRKTPSVRTTNAVETSSQVVLQGEATAAGQVATARFEWGEAIDALTQITPEIPVAKKDVNFPLQHTLTGLVAGRVYYYRARLDVAGTTIFGGTLSFVQGNNAPLAVPDTHLIVPGPAAATLHPLFNDIDLDGDTLTITAVQGGDHGAVAIAADGASIIYTPDAGFAGEDSFSYTISDDHGATDSAFVFLTVGNVRPAAVTQTVILSSGAPLPPLANGGTVPGFIKHFYMPAISDSRALVVLMGCRVDGKRAQGIYHQSPDGTETTLAHSRGAAPGWPGATFKILLDPLISPGGVVAFAARIKGAGINSANDDGLWSTHGGALHRMIAENATLSFLQGARVKRIVNYSLRDGDILTRLILVHDAGITARNDEVLARIAPNGSGAVLAREGESLGVGGVPTPIAFINSPSRSYLHAGQSRAHGDGMAVAQFVLADGRTALAAYPVGEPPRLLAISGITTPGLGTWEYFYQIAVGPHGSGFAALGLFSDPLGLRLPAILYSENGETIDTLIAGGSVAPGAPNATFSTFTEPFVNDARHIAFLGTLTGQGAGTNNSGLWAGPADALQLIERIGSPARGPEGGIIPGATWQSFHTYALPSGDAPGPLFTAHLTGADFEPANREGLWARCTDGVTRQLLRTGELIEVNGRARPISYFGVLQGALGVENATRSFNATGSVAVLVGLEDNTRALVRIDIP